MKRAIPFLALGAAALTLHTAWNLRHLRRLPTPSTEVTDDVRVLVPARNEAVSIAATITSIRQQRGVSNLRADVLDDGSADGTAQIAIEASEDDPRVHIHRADDAPPPQGWLGKNYACARLVELTEEQTSTVGTDTEIDVLVFVDADVTLQPDAVASLVAELRSKDLALVAPYPRQYAVGWLERLIQPLLVWSWATTVPLEVAERRQWASMSVANGQLMAFDAAAYRAIGGHATVRGEVIEDVELMRAVRMAGMRAATVDGSNLASCRMYESTNDLIDGYTKSAWRAFGGPAGSIAVNAALVGLYVLPPAAMLLGRGRTRLWGLFGYLAGVSGRAAVARHTGERIWPDALAHPLSILAFAAINALSWRRHLTGTTVWKGRTISPGVQRG